MLGKADKSAKASWDEKTLELCERLNSSGDYYTTSSCSGKCVMIEERTGKNGDYYLWTNHGLITFEEVNDVIKQLEAGCRKLDANTINGGIRDGAVRKSRGGLIKFKCDPPAIFVCCRDIDVARGLLLLVKDCGFKQSGIVITNKIIGVEIKSGERLEFPIVNDGKLLVDSDYLKLVIELVNRKRKAGWRKIESLKVGLFDGQIV